MTLPGPRDRAPSETLRAALERGAFDEACRLGAEATDPAAVLLHATALGKTDPPAAIARLHALDRATLSDDQSVERASLLGLNYATVREYALAHDAFEQGRGHAADHSSDAYIDLIYREARCFGFERDTDSAWRLLGELREQTSARARIRALQLDVTIASYERRYADQACLLMRLIETIGAAREYLEIWAWSMHTLAALARELYLPEARTFVERHIDDRAWTGAFAINHFQTLKALAWAQALQGDYFNAFRHLRAAGACATTPAWRVVAHADRAFLARNINEPRWSRQEILEAEELARTLDWQTITGEERIALLLLAELLAPIDPTQASYYAAEFARNKEGAAPMLHYSDDERAHALTASVMGVVQIALHSERAGVRLLRESLEIFERNQYDWRAGLTALRLYEVTKDARLIGAIEERLKHYRNCWLAELANAAIGEATRQLPPRLTPVQTTIFHAICDGKSTAEIAEELGRSEHTVRNHVKLILKAFGVKNRALLPAEATRYRMR